MSNEGNKGTPFWPVSRPPVLGRGEAPSKELPPTSSALPRSPFPSPFAPRTNPLSRGFMQEPRMGRDDVIKGTDDDAIISKL
ncbi:hypothetical protein BG004_004369, partial [Podila humilis]